MLKNGPEKILSFADLLKELSHHRQQHRKIIFARWRIRPVTSWPCYFAGRS